MSKVVLVGGGHVNCQVLKILKNVLPSGSKLTMVSECDRSFYSGMLPGSTSNIYDPKEIQVELKPVAAFWNAEFIEERVERISGNENKLILESGSQVDYDVLAINVGSKTKNTFDAPGVLEHSLTTRPINDLLGKIENREQELIDTNTIPKVVVCGAGWAGVELSFGFKNRWSKIFNQEIDVSIISNHDTVLPSEKSPLRNEVIRKLQAQNITMYNNTTATEVTKEGVICSDGTHIEGNVVVWCTGAEPQPVTENSDLDISKGYFRVNEYLQSTSHSNVFGAGDCVTMTPYEHLSYPFPPKAGVYAVRGGPVMSNNIANYIMGKELSPYVPQDEFLALLMTGDGKAIGQKFGMAFSGKWVWKLKDFIDVGFMKLFDPHMLFNDYDTKGYAEPVEDNRLFEEEGKLQNTYIYCHINHYFYKL